MASKDEAKGINATLLAMRNTIEKFWTGKRVVQLVLFALIMANVTYYLVDELARRQVNRAAFQQHDRIYTAYGQLVDRFRQPPEDRLRVEPSGRNGRHQKESSVIGNDPTSPYWLGLVELQRQFSFHRMAILLPESSHSEGDREAIQRLKNRPTSWSVHTEEEGWASTYYLLPGRELAALKVTSYINDDLSAWGSTALVIAGYAFFLLVAFGWFWTRALADSYNNSSHPAYFANARTKAMKLTRALAQMERVLADVDTTARAASDSAGQVAKGRSDFLERNSADLAARIRMLAINGVVEAARSPADYRVFQVLLEEIHRLAGEAEKIGQSGELAKTQPNVELNELRECLKNMEEATNDVYREFLPVKLAG